MERKKTDWTQTHACNSKLTSLHVFLHKINNFYTLFTFFRIPLLVADIQTWSSNGWTVQLCTVTYILYRWAAYG
jgi:hypothetical protein